MPKVATLKRDFKTASVADGQVQLDGKPLRTPANHNCMLPTPAMADAIAAEWNAQGDKLVPTSMPLTQLAFTALDRVPIARTAIEEEVLRYLGTELICHYADTAEAAAWQRTRWQPVHDWLQTRFSVILPVTTRMAPLPESDSAWAALHVAAYDDFRLCALQQAVNVTGSFAIALALVEGGIMPEAALDAAEAETDYNAQTWGVDQTHVDGRAAQLAELTAVQTFIGLLT